MDEPRRFEMQDPNTNESVGWGVQFDGNDGPVAIHRDNFTFSHVPHLEGEDCDSQTYRPGVVVHSSLIGMLTVEKVNIRYLDVDRDTEFVTAESYHKVRCERRAARAAKLATIYGIND